MWVGSLWYSFLMIVAPMLELVLGFKIPSIERMWVASNMGIAFHRYNEFMYLMLGETVLQVAKQQVLTKSFSYI